MSDDYPRLTKLKRHGKDWGEFRATGGQTIIHGIHPTGQKYVILKRSKPIEIRFTEIVWPEGVNVSALQKRTESGLPFSSVPLRPLRSSSVSSLDEAVNIALPPGPGQNHSYLFLLARAIKGYETDAGVTSARERITAFQKWYDAALQREVLRPGQPRDKYLAEFFAAYKRVKYPLGLNEMILEALAAAKLRSPPPEAGFLQGSEAKLLVSLCVEIQKRAGDSEWYLAARTAGRLIGLSHPAAALYLGMLVDLGFLMITISSTSKKARRYKCLIRSEEHAVRSSRSSL